jgi:hypothetical protein
MRFSKLELLTCFRDNDKISQFYGSQLMTQQKKTDRLRLIIVSLISFSALIAFVFAVLFLFPVEQAVQTIKEDLQAESSAHKLLAQATTFAANQKRFGAVDYRASASQFTDAIYFNSTYYISSSTGIFIVSLTGEVIDVITWQNGLPHASVTDLEIFNGALYAATPAGLARLEKERLTTFSLKDRALWINCLTVHDNRLVLGCEDGTILTFTADGQFSLEYNQLPGKPTSPITAINVWRNMLVAGTRDAGFFILTGSSFTKFDKPVNLPSSTVTDLVNHNEDLYVATLAGIVVFDSLKSSKVIPGTGLINAMASDGDSLLLGSAAGSVYRLQNSKKILIDQIDPDQPTRINRIVSSLKPLILSQTGVLQLDDNSIANFGRGWNEYLVWPHISSLAKDSSASLWIGYFDSGLEIRSQTFQPVGRYLDDERRYIKTLIFDGITDEILIGSSKGLYFYNERGLQRSIRQTDGLISDEVNHVQRISENLIGVATGSGLSILSHDSVESLNAFHGLSSNKSLCLTPYTSQNKTFIYLGSLGGMDVINDQLAIQSYTPDNSGLPAHWVSAFAVLEQRILVGTYTRGLAFFDPQLKQFFPVEEFSTVTVNPLAMIVSGENIYVGTLDHGLLIYNQSSDSWHQITQWLPSKNVTALAMQGNTLLCGTELGLAEIDTGSISK